MWIGIQTYMLSLNKKAVKTDHPPAKKYIDLKTYFGIISAKKIHPYIELFAITYLRRRV